MELDELLKIYPFSENPPNNPLVQTRVFVRELAIGAVYRYWGASFNIKTDADTHENYDLLTDYIIKKWQDLLPDISILASQGYLEATKNPGYNIYVLTPDAYKLVEETRTVAVFISYRNETYNAAVVNILNLLGVAP